MKINFEFGTAFDVKTCHKQIKPGPGLIWKKKIYCCTFLLHFALKQELNQNNLKLWFLSNLNFLAICLAFFPPSESFFPYLLGFIQKHRDPNLDFPEIGQWPIHVQVRCGTVQVRVD